MHLVLNEDKENQKAIHCRIICQIHLGLFEDAVKLIDGLDQTLG